MVNFAFEILPEMFCLTENDYTNFATVAEDVELFGVLCPSLLLTPGGTQEKLN